VTDTSTEQQPRVSILLPAWNAADTLRSCLSSITRQTLTDWECVIVDDGSTDGTAAIAVAATRSDARFRVVTRPHAGLIAALNEGLRHCRGGFIARMDADDLMHRDRLAAQICALERDRSLSAVGCHVRLCPRALLSPRLREYEAWLNGLRDADDVTRDAFVECPVAHPSLMMRREMATLGYADHDWPEDYDLVLRALAAGMRIGVVAQRLLSWRDWPDSLSRTAPRYDIARFTACKAHYLAHGFLSATATYRLWGYGGTGRAFRRALDAHGKRPSHIVEVKPTRLGQRILGAPVIPPDALPGLKGGRLVVSVARSGPRTEIRSALASMGFVEGDDYVCAA
jgi:glycosyltransferase involved in cell wall biosynthesis